MNKLNLENYPLAKAELEKYLHDDFMLSSNEAEHILNHNYFKNIPFPMQYGVYLEYFDSVGIRITIEDLTFIYFEVFIHQENNRIDYSTGETSRPEAQKAAIEKAFKIREEQLKQAG